VQALRNQDSDNTEIMANSFPSQYSSKNAAEAESNNKKLIELKGPNWMENASKVL